MDNSKISPQVQLALRYSNILPYNAFLQTIGQPIGELIWEVVVTYSGDIEKIKESLAVDITQINAFLAVIKISKYQIEKLATLPEIAYIEFPEVMQFTLQEALSEICAKVATSPTSDYHLSGKGIAIGIIDSGIDYFHQDFIEANGQTRIAYLWDQNAVGEASDEVSMGVVYTAQQINEALQQASREESLNIVPQQDTIGHGTAVAGIAAGNGRGSNGRYKGVAIESQLIVVKLLERFDPQTGERIGSRNIDVMQGIRFALKKSHEIGMPIVINLGLGINEGSHDGDNLLEVFLQWESYFYKASIVVATGNEGNQHSHYEGKIEADREEIVRIFVDNNQPYYFCTLWKSFLDEIELVIETPWGETTEILQGIINNRAFVLGNTLVMVNFSESSRTQTGQQIIVFFERFNANSINAGEWKLRITGTKVTDGQFNVWGASINPLERSVYFGEASPYKTLTIPSTAHRITSVGAYNGLIDQLVDFSGRGYTRDGRIKPDVVAPGVNIMAPLTGTFNQYTMVSGTSVAGALVSGGYALLMQYGIIEKKDDTLFGERLKAYVIKNTKQPMQYAPYPNPQWGYGQICIEQVLSELRRKYNAT